jgi:hypothetical protein
MRVSEAVTLPSNAFRRPLELSGYLIVSSHLVCVVEDEVTANSGRPHYGVLVNRDAIDALNAIDLPLLAGSSVSLVGNIALKGTVTHTGISAFPLYIPYIYGFTFSNDIGTWEFQIGEIFRDVYLLSRPTVAPQSIALIKTLFPPSVTVMELKRLLESEPEHCIGRHLRADAFSKLIQTIETAGFMWRAEECDIVRGIP